MSDIEKQVAYWRDGAAEDWEVAEELVQGGRPRHGLFFAHLALEKILKAHVCRRTGNLAPKIHNLVRLAELADVSLNIEQLRSLAAMNAFSLEGRYPHSGVPLLTSTEANEYLETARELLQWLTSQFGE